MWKTKSPERAKLTFKKQEEIIWPTKYYDILQNNIIK